ncbi:unnamed protein product [Sphagnum troendelagicum]|uniref:ATPase AAA-type core domain-containing protein n=1 Tax=Sphagnum troendelagicum TaxID=128251 RepID=A0ABP0UEI1_9BRYO
MVQKVNDSCGMKESDTGLAVPSEWDLNSDKQMMQEEQPLQFVVGLRDKVSPMDIEEGMHVVELPMLHPEKFVKLGIDRSKGILCYGPPETGKTLLTCAVANQQMLALFMSLAVRLSRIDAIGGAQFDDGSGGGNEVQRTMLEIVNQLDGFDSRGNIKVLMATNRLDMLDPALFNQDSWTGRLSLGCLTLKVGPSRSTHRP